LAAKRQIASGIAGIHAMSLDTEYLEWKMDLHAMRRKPYSNDMLASHSLSLFPSCFFLRNADTVNQVILPGGWNFPESMIVE